MCADALSVTPAPNALNRRSAEERQASGSAHQGVSIAAIGVGLVRRLILVALGVAGGAAVAVVLAAREQLERPPAIPEPPPPLPPVEQPGLGIDA
jgi:hypothetical protein